MYSVLRNADERLSMPHVTPKTLINITTGISSLDAILGSGIPLGSLVLIEEDEHGYYSRIFTKCFLSEGITCHDSVFLASKDENPESVINDLPQPIPKKEDKKVTSSEELQIAWRYKNTQQVLSEPASLKNSLISHEFDFSCKIPSDKIECADVTIWPKDNRVGNDKCGLIDDILKFTSSLKSCKEPMKAKKIMRVVVQGLGSPFWQIESQSIYQVFLKLRTIVHNSCSVALVTIPSNLFGDQVFNRCMQLSDIVISLKSLINNNDPSLKEFSGLIKFSKISPVNSFSIHVPEDIDWAFKVVKKKLIIQKLHLPPESNLTGQREQDDLASVSMPACQINF
ncbi:elongator complex protein 4 [Halyomorpha halys]|uniref:elongator complex protein 4 n=1 Tax=Halyomorpha halys TaxID=286706 RepID=UPI0006D51DBC|nr:putative elongator complex protein 4 [Halyomorpha halys]